MFSPNVFFLVQLGMITMQEPTKKLIYIYNYIYMFSHMYYSRFSLGGLGTLRFFRSRRWCAWAHSMQWRRRIKAWWPKSRSQFGWMKASDSWDVYEYVYLASGLEPDFYFSTYWEWSFQLTNIFQTGWNHQSVIIESSWTHKDKQW